MKNQIILASGSVQRKNLLEQVGLTFSVEQADVQENMTITSSCAALVKSNARLKARYVAQKHSSGLVIGADTVVFAGNKKIMGKPKDLKDAKRILRVLFSKPCWIYTGVAVIDAATSKTQVDYEKTKVFMRALSEKEIQAYHHRVNPFDKAGGFDIEGWGSLFIHRIEGDYANVIGLPLAKLSLMLKGFGFSILEQEK